MFQRGQRYTRDEIHDEAGGSKQSYLPTAGGRVVAACLKSKTNPDAPRIILPGQGKGIERAAEILIGQGTAIPIFVKRRVNEWEYVGDYKVDRWSEDAAEIEAQSQRSGRDDITRVIYMKP
jgi:hypothetical protein